MIIHELAVTESLLKIVLKHAEENGATRVLSIHLQVGELRDLTEEWIQRYFDYLSEGTSAEGGKIIMTGIPVTFKCGDCAHTFSADIRQNNLRCPACGQENCELVAGNEFLIESIEVI